MIFLPTQMKLWQPQIFSPIQMIFTTNIHLCGLKFSCVLAKISSVLAKFPSVLTTIFIREGYKFHLCSSKFPSVLAKTSSVLSHISSAVAKISAVVAQKWSLVAKNYLWCLHYRLCW